MVLNVPTETAKVWKMNIVVECIDGEKKGEKSKPRIKFHFFFSFFFGGGGGLEGSLSSQHLARKVFMSRLMSISIKCWKAISEQRDVQEI